jgi:hypothetical protein
MNRPTAPTTHRPLVVAAGQLGARVVAALFPAPRRPVAVRTSPRLPIRRPTPMR